MQTSVVSWWHLVPSSTFSANWTTMSAVSSSLLKSSSSPLSFVRPSRSPVTSLLSMLSLSRCSFLVRRKSFVLVRSFTGRTPRQIKEHGLVRSWWGYHLNSCPLYGTLSKAAHCSERKSLGGSHVCNQFQVRILQFSIILTDSNSNSFTAYHKKQLFHLTVSPQTFSKLWQNNLTKLFE